MTATGRNTEPTMPTNKERHPNPGGSQKPNSPSQQSEKKHGSSSSGMSSSSGKSGMSSGDSQHKGSHPRDKDQNR